MKIYNNLKDKQEIKTLDAWQRFFTKADSKGTIHWKSGRSAESLAKYIIEKNGAAKIKGVLSSVFSGNIELQYAVPEYEVRFDSFSGNGRKHDLGIVGTIDGKPLFVGVEAKVDESFGPTVAEQYTTAVINRWKGESTNIPERVEKLLACFFVNGVPTKAATLRYQLFTAIAGTCAAKLDNKDFAYYVFLVLEFNTGSASYDKKKASENHKDLSNFLKEVEAEKCDNYFKKSIGGKEVFILFESKKL